MRTGIADVEPQVIADMLSLVTGVSIPAGVIATWAVWEREAAARWAAAEHLHASDNARVRRLPRPALVSRTVEIVRNPALAQLAVEAWTAFKEAGEFSSGWEDVYNVAQDAITGLLVLLGGQPEVRPNWQDSAVGIMWRHPEGVTATDLAAMLCSSCPPQETLDGWLLEGERSGLLDQPSRQVWRLAWRLKETP